MLHLLLSAQGLPAHWSHSSDHYKRDFTKLQVVIRLVQKSEPNLTETLNYEARKIMAELCHYLLFIACSFGKLLRLIKQT